MGLLAAAVRAAIEAGAPYRHRWFVSVPYEAGVAPTVNNELHDDLAYTDSGGVTRRCVIDPGKRIVEAYNKSLSVPGELSRGYYAIGCDNSDGRFYVTTAGNVWYSTSGDGYQANPVECHLNHWIYVLAAPDAPADPDSWARIYPITYRGKIVNVAYDNDQKTATIEAIGLAALALEYVWTEDDAIEQDTGGDVLL
ncbi:MAG TPA: hypothetical protein PLL30_17185 [Candidatus Krumholzibacteria bacterium]|nr:hypothetical protein [Candidatus Krumholzibacteria bacterium]HPD73510.1 hypothetical protein [Candidatus Krumholzibacteria bacterium]HRY42232.1 hypothetical protein [Candidatus Krumholzibacteria bacterium]